jgi:hypothetical protein
LIFAVLVVGFIVAGVCIANSGLSCFWLILVAALLALSFPLSELLARAVWAHNISAGEDMGVCLRIEAAFRGDEDLALDRLNDTGRRALNQWLQSLSKDRAFSARIKQRPNLASLLSSPPSIAQR